MSPTSGNETIVKEITIKASAERVFEPLTDPRQRVKWWGVEGKFQATQMESDLRPGGAWVMRGTGIGGSPFTVQGEYLTVDRPRVLEFTWLPDWRQEPQTLVRFELEEKDGTTVVRLIHSGLTTASSRERYQSWPWLLASLQAHAERAASGGAS